MDQPGKVANEFSLSPFAPENLVSREGFDRPVLRQPVSLLLDTQAESVTILLNYYK